MKLWVVKWISNSDNWAYIKGTHETEESGIWWSLWGEQQNVGLFDVCVQFTCDENVFAQFPVKCNTITCSNPSWFHTNVEFKHNLNIIFTSAPRVNHPHTQILVFSNSLLSFNSVCVYLLVGICTILLLMRNKPRKNGNKWRKGQFTNEREN